MEKIGRNCVFLLYLVSFGLFAAEYTVPRAAYSLDAEDLDLDGDRDIVVGHIVSWQNSQIERKTISILKNVEYGNFAVFDTSISYCGYQENIMAKNIDGDGYPDLITFMSDFSSGVADRYIRIYYNDYGTFDTYKDYTLNSDDTFSEITSGDVDGDVDIDIVVGSNQSQFWGVLYNDGTGQFSLPTYYSIGYPADIKCSDLNDDHRDDVIICSGSVQVFFSDTSGFTHAIIDSIEHETEIADIDQDGDQDMVGLYNIYLAGYTGITLYENQGNRAFKVHDEVLFQPALSYLELADMNHDSLPDVVCTGDDGIYILWNRGGYQLSDPEFVEVPNYDAGLLQSICADLDGNGYPDLIAIRYNHYALSGNLHILFNDGRGNFVEEPVVAIDEKTPLLPQDFRLYQNYPNPFNNSTAISYYLPGQSEMELSICTLTGTLVRILAAGHQKRGRYTVYWNGTNQDGKGVSSGVYLYALRVRNNIISKRMILIR